MPVATGWVVCGDKRRTNSLFAGSDDEVKVFELTRNVVAAMTGLRRVNENNSTYFDVAESVKAFERANRFDGRPEFADALAKALGDAFVASVPRRIWPQVEQLEVTGPAAFTVMLFWIDAAGLPHWAETRFHLKGGPRYTSRSTRERAALTNGLRTLAIGNLAVIQELQHGGLPSFADARRDPDIRSFLIARYTWRERTADDAERFGRRIIEFTSERLPELDKKESNVGSKADCERVSRRVA